MSMYNMNSMMTSREMAFAVIALPFQAIARWCTYAFQNSSRMVALDKLNAMTDDDLKKLGVTRAQAAMQMLGTY